MYKKTCCLLLLSISALASNPTPCPPAGCPDNGLPQENNGGYSETIVAPIIATPFGIEGNTNTATINNNTAPCTGPDCNRRPANNQINNEMNDLNANHEIHDNMGDMGRPGPAGGAGGHMGGRR